MADTEHSWPEPMRTDVLEALARTQKQLPTRYLYDAHGSELFEQITDLPEYYPTRTELALLEARATEIADKVGPRARIIEYGAGALRKIRILLDALESPSIYVPVDVAGEFLARASETLEAAYPELQVKPVIGSFTAPRLDINLPGGDGRALGFFPGSTLGNLNDTQIAGFFGRARKHLGKDGWFLLGVDVNQDPASLVPAYDDSASVTAEFNLNLLRRMNRDLDANFDLDMFSHRAVWDPEKSRMEMHLVSAAEQIVTVAGQDFHFDEGETIHTENSRKFTRDQIASYAQAAGWGVGYEWRSPCERMALYLLT